jgi:hypothetical protein
MSRDSQGPRKTFSKGGSSDFNKRKSFSSSDKAKRPRSSGDSSEKRPYTKREDSSKDQVNQVLVIQEKKEHLVNAKMEVLNLNQAVALVVEKNVRTQKEKIVKTDLAEVLEMAKESHL